MRLFFYGTLMDADVRNCVLSRALPVSVGEVRGFRRVCMAGRTYPMLIPCAGGKVQGLVADGASEDDLACLLRYEGPEYQMCAVDVVTASGPVVAQAFMSTAPAQRRDWHLDQWRLRHKRFFLHSWSLRKSIF